MKIVRTNMKMGNTKFKTGGLHEKHVVATWNLGNHLSICFYTQENQEKPVSRWPVAGPSKLQNYKPSKIQMLCESRNVAVL